MQGQGWESGEPIRVLVADDDAGFRGQLRATLDHDDEITVVSEAADGKQAVELIADLAPDVVLLDVRMPVLSGPQAAARVRQTSPVTKILMLTASDEEEDLYAAVTAGANGYLLKDASLHEVTGAVKAVMAGHSLVSPAMAAKLLTEFQALSRRKQRVALPPGPVLSERELEILKLVACGRKARDLSRRIDRARTRLKPSARQPVAWSMPLVRSSGQIAPCRSTLRSDSACLRTLPS